MTLCICHALSNSVPTNKNHPPQSVFNGGRPNSWITVVPLFSHHRRRASPPSGNVSHYFTTRFFVVRSCQSFGSDFIGVLSNATFSNPPSIAALMCNQIRFSHGKVRRFYRRDRRRVASAATRWRIEGLTSWAAPPPGLANGSRIVTAISVMRLLYLQAAGKCSAPRFLREKHIPL